MEPLPEFLFSIFALSLPRGHAFGDRPPREAWISERGLEFAAITQGTLDNKYGVLAMRKRIDGVWEKTLDAYGFNTIGEARARTENELDGDAPLLPMPPGVIRRPALHDFGGKPISKMFQLLAQPSHQKATWLLNQLYLALPNPDRNWTSDCQTENFHTRLWEAILLACFREQGLLVEQPEESPDFRIENNNGCEAWVEAVTANPTERFEHVNATPTGPPSEPEEIFRGAAALRFAKSIGSKLQRNYHILPHVTEKPFALAIADFHAPGSMVWSREALIGYLYGLAAKPVELGGRRIAKGKNVDYLMGNSGFPSGLFRNSAHEELSAIIFTNAATISKLNRIPISAGAPSEYRYVRYGRFYDKTPGALEGIPFCLDVASDEYRTLWPVGYEPWCAELEVFHNPFARHPIRRELLPEATHWFEREGAIDDEAFYDTSILWSRTLILNKQDPMPTYDTMPTYLQNLARRRRHEILHDQPGSLED